MWKQFFKEYMVRIKSVSKHSFLHKYTIFLVCAFLAACATAPKPAPVVEPGQKVETIQSAVALSLKVGETSRSARGFLIFRGPDRFHLAVLGPFGITLLEVYSDHDRLTCIIPTKETACSGLFSDLPANSGLQSWEIMKWAMETEPSGPQGVRERVTATGARERVSYDERGLLSSKESEQGNQLFYRDYRSIDDVAFPGTIEFKNTRGVNLKISFIDPDLNKPVEDAALTANTAGLTMTPLANCGGITP